MLQDESVISAFTVFTTGKIQFNLGWVHGRVPDSLLEDWIAALRRIRGFRTLPDDALGKWPNFSLARAFSDPADLEQFEQSVLALKEAIRHLDKPPA